METRYFFWLVMVLLGCDKRLDIEPQQAISTEVALDDERGIETAIVGMYSIFAGTQLFSGHPILNADLFSNTNDLVWTNFAPATLSPIFRKEISTSNEVVADFWINAYWIISQANRIDEALQRISIDNSLGGQVYFMRGFLYFSLLEFFAEPWSAGNPNGPGVPIVNLSSINEENRAVPRNPIFEVTDQVIADLALAKQYLPAENGFFPTTYSASALLSRIYMTQEEFDLAAQEADRVISSGQFELLASHQDVFNQASNTPEDIFAIQITSTNGTNHMSHFYSGQLEGGGGFIGITDNHLEHYEPGDQRLELFYFDQQQMGTRRTGKWLTRPSFDGNISIIRLAEMYLNRAEARFHIADLDGATADLNVIRTRAGLPVLDSTAIDLEIILMERYRELVFEGHQLRDRKRTRSAIGDLPFDDPSLIFPIPQREMDVNPALVQNQGY